MFRTTIMILIFLISFSTAAVAVEPSMNSSVTLKEYIERVIDERYKLSKEQFEARDKLSESQFKASKQALELSQSSLDQRFVRLEKFLQDTAIYNEKIARISEQLTQVTTTFTEKINDVGGRIAILETNNSRTFENVTKLTRGNETVIDRINSLSGRIALIESDKAKSLDNAKNWIIGIGIFFTIVQIGIQFFNRKKEN